MSLIPSLLNPLHVVFVNNQGITEEGQDAGGIFKEFLTKLIKIVYDPNYGLFVLTQQNELYPNAKSGHLFGKGEDINIYRFLGRLLGKAIYEGITVEPRFADFFLRKLINKPSSLHDLKSLDPDLYK